MTHPFSVRSRSIPLACLSLVAALAGCGGGSDSTQPDVALLAGDWQFQRCNLVDGQGTRNLMRIQRQDPMTFTLNPGLVRYANSDCTGSSTVQVSPPEQTARFVARRNGSTASMAVFWANWTYEPTANSPSSQWVRKGDFLCQSFFAPPARSSAGTAVTKAAEDTYDLARTERETDASLQDRVCHALAPA